MINTGKRILVTAATSALAKALISRMSDIGGYEVMLASRSQSASYDANRFENLKQISGLDLAEEKCLKTLSDEVGAFFSEPFTTMHFAGDFWRHKPLLTTPFTEIRGMIESHYLTLCGVAHAITPIMGRLGGGMLVAFSCNSVSYNYPDMSPFTAAKAAIESFMRCYSNEYAPYGIAGAALALPTMRTPEVLNDKPTGDHENYISPEDLAEVLLQGIVSQSTFLTGNILRLIKPSPSFYGEGYFQRNPRTEEANIALYRTYQKAVRR